jgi:uncharacterized secreted protein with C-terminal beta-propeller domain
MKLKRNCGFAAVLCVLVFVSLPIATTLHYTGESEFSSDNLKRSDKQILECGKVIRFTSHEELVEYIKNASHMTYRYINDLFVSFDTTATQSITASGSETSTSQPNFSNTNIQVDGVDEVDIVKTDGIYLYVVSENNIVIMKGFLPDEARILSRIQFENKPTGIFVNGDRLVVIRGTSEILQHCYDDTSEDCTGDCVSTNCYTYSLPKTNIRIYDIADREDPKLAQEVTVSGNYFNSRMIGDYVYLISHAEVSNHFNRSKIILPEVDINGELTTIRAEEIAYFEESQNSTSYVFTIVTSVNIKNNNDVNYDVYLSKWTKDIYVSNKYIYLTDSGYSLGPTFGFMPVISRHSRNTAIHKISINEGKICYVTSGEVPGNVLNQFSMDEYDDYFRIATHNWVTGTNVFVLDAMLDLVGKLEGIAPGERMHSARFMGERCYLVTFKKVDPFFVIIHMTWGVLHGIRA